MNQVDAMEDLAPGSLTAPAIEPDHGKAAGHTHENACLNCGTQLAGSHCHQCGQQAHVHRTLGAFFHDLLHGLLHFEGKIWRTLPLLAWRPGRLTREYIDGRRASYVSPIALFLFTVFLVFAIFNGLGGAERLGETIDSDPTRETQQALDAADAELAKLRERLARQEDAEARAEVQSDIAAADRQRDALQSALQLGRQTEPETEPAAVSAKSPGEQRAEDRVRSAWQKARENPQLLLYKLQSNAYKFSWLLIPLSVPFVALTFAWRRRLGLYDHTVFTTYSITFMLALVTLATLTSAYVSGQLGFLLLLYAPVHMYRQLRETYQLRRRSTLWRLVVLSAFAWVAIGLFALALFMLSES